MKQYNFATSIAEMMKSTVVLNALLLNLVFSLNLSSGGVTGILLASSITNVSLADFIACIGTLDVVLGEVDH